MGGMGEIEKESVNEWIQSDEAVQTYQATEQE
jgi:Na+-transporting methylmalonyl-CoA/oxaloacetate decarboxylase gamma subunit